MPSEEKRLQTKNVSGLSVPRGYRRKLYFYLCFPSGNNKKSLKTGNHKGVRLKLSGNKEGLKVKK